MKIAMITPEIASLSHKTRLAENLKSLVIHLKDRIHTIIPYYDYLDIPTSKIVELDNVTIFEADPISSEKKIYLIKPKSDFFPDFLDDNLDFDSILLFSIGALEFLNWSEEFDIVHCHSWQTGLIPLLIKNSGNFSSTKTFFSFYNLNFIGAFQLTKLEELNIKNSLLAKRNLNLFVNSLKNLFLCFLITAEIGNPLSALYRPASSQLPK